MEVKSIDSWIILGRKFVIATSNFLMNIQKVGNQIHTKFSCGRSSSQPIPRRSRHTQCYGFFTCTLEIFYSFCKTPFGHFLLFRLTGRFRTREQMYSNNKHFPRETWQIFQKSIFLKEISRFNIRVKNPEKRKDPIIPCRD